MGVEPATLSIGDGTHQVHVGAGLFSKPTGIRTTVVAGDEEVIVGQLLHHRQESSEILLLGDHTHRKEEGTLRGED